MICPAHSLALALLVPQQSILYSLFSLQLHYSPPLCHFPSPGHIQSALLSLCSRQFPIPLDIFSLLMHNKNLSPNKGVVMLAIYTESPCISVNVCPFPGSELLNLGDMAEGIWSNATNHPLRGVPRRKPPRFRTWGLRLEWHDTSQTHI